MNTTLQIQIQRAHKTYCPPGWSWSNLGREKGIYNLWMINSGEGTLSIGNQIHTARAGDCFLIPLWKPCTGQQFPETPLVVPWIFFQAPLSLEKSLQFKRRIREPALFSTLMEKTINWFLEDNGSSPRSEQSLRVILDLLQEEDARTPAAGPEAAQIHAVQKICTEIRARPEKLYTIEKLAASMHYSPDHFTRLFKKFTGKTPRDFIVQTRIEAAKSLLLLSEFSISEVAEQLGYSDLFHFSRQFKEKCGCSPNTYRKMP